MKWSSLVPELSVSNFEISLNFYVTLIGFKVDFQRTNPNFAYMSLGEVQFMIEEVHTNAWLTGELNPPFGRGINFQIEVESIEPILLRLKTSKIPLYRDVQDVIYQTGLITEAQREFLVQDPDGYLLRFVEILT